MNSLELFSGAGGLALGFSNAGFKHLGVFEWNKDACDTIRLNQIRGIPPIKDWNLVPGDVREHSFRNWAGKVTLVAGGPPCQPFSIGGKHRGSDDTRNMFPEAARCVRETLPKAFVLENVKGLLRKPFATYFSYITLSLTYPFEPRRKGESWQDHLGRLEKMHTKGYTGEVYYHVVFRLLNAADYGVPQKRERVFIVGFRNDLNREWCFPEPSHTESALLHSKWVTGEYWENHRIPRARRPSSPPGVRGRVERAMAEDMFSALPWRTV